MLGNFLKMSVFVTECSTLAPDEDKPLAQAIIYEERYGYGQ
jgi:hypothetical protein